MDLEDTQKEHICKLIDECLSRYPEWVDKPGQDKYYAVALILTKSEMLLLRKCLEQSS